MLGTGQDGGECYGKAIDGVSPHRWEKPSCLARLRREEIQLKKTFPLWSQNIELLLKNSEHVKFLQSMKTDRIATFGSKDAVLVKKIQRKKTHSSCEQKRQEKARQYQDITSSSATLASSSDDSCCSESDCDAMESTSQCSSSKPHRRQKVGTHTFIQPDILQFPKLVSLATPLNMTPAQQNAFTKALIDESAGDSSKVYLSYSYADKSRWKIPEKIATAVKQTWQAPKLASLHWDSKLVMSLQNQQILEERLTIAVGTKDNIKLLGVLLQRTPLGQNICILFYFQAFCKFLGL